MAKRGRSKYYSPLTDKTHPMYSFGGGAKKLGIAGKKPGMIKLPKIIKSWD